MITKGNRIQAFTDLGSVDLITDMLIAKRDKERRNEFEIIALSLFGTRLDLQKVTKMNSMVRFRLLGNRRSYGREYRIPKISDYDTEEVRGKYTTRVSLVRKKELLLDQTEQKNPIIIIPGNEKNRLEETVFEYVREAIVAPLFPNLTDPSKLSKELFIKKDEAVDVLENIKQGNIISENERIAKDGIEKYNQWVKYLYDSLYNKNRINELSVVCFDDSDVLAYEIVVKEEEIKNIITEGIQNGNITISNRKSHWSHYSEFDQYMKRYAPILKKVIESQSEPIHRKGEVREDTKKTLSTLNKKAIPAQKEAIEAMVKSVQYQSKVNIVGEPGVGKTFMMSTASYLDAEYASRPLKALVLSPDHLVKTTWEKEIEETYNDAEYHHIRSIRDLIKYEKKGYFEDKEHRFFILSQGVAKSGYSESPKVIWDKRKRHFKCPDCYAVIEKNIINEKANTNYGEPKYIRVPVTYDHFRTQRYNNRKCEKCKTVLWGVNNRRALTGFTESISGKKKENQFVYSTMGFIPRDEETIRIELEVAVKRYNEKRNRMTTARVRDLREVEMVLQGVNKEKNRVSPYKVPVSYFIKKKMKRKFTHLIIDEYHQFQSGTTSRSESAAEIIASVSKVITGTGTMMNGYARSRFFNDFMLFPEKMKRAGFNINDIEKYQVAFGVTESRYRLTDDGKRTSLAPKSKPGISPVIFPLFLQDSTVFISMKDLENDMPDLKHEIVEIEMANELKEGRKKLEQAVRTATRGNLKLFKGLMPTLYSYLDMPTVEREVKDEDENLIYTTEALELKNDRKMDALRKIIRDEKLKDRRTIVYTHYTGDGINDYIKRKLEEDGFRVTVLNKHAEYSISCDGTESKVEKDVRENYIKEEVDKGTDVLIVNPILVQTGTNLIDFASIVYYQMSYQVYTVRQADRRTWRIGQEQDCTIYYLYYKDSFQADIASLMATKIVASESIEGNMDARGLEAITNDRTPEEELAKKFFEHMNF